LETQTYRDFEVVVVDNGSTDGTLEDLRDRAVTNAVPHGVTVLSEPGSLGRVRNAGVAAARGALLAFVDSDCVPTAAWLEEGLAPFVGPGGDRVGTVQGCTRPDPSLGRGRWDATQELTSFTGRYEACNIFYRRDALLAAGGFDEAVGFFGEDSAAGWAVRRLGLEERFVPAALVHHTVTFPGISWHWRRGLRYGNWNVLVRRFPEVRSLFWRRWFLRRDSARTFLALVGLALALAQRRQRARWLLLVLPFVRHHRPRTLTRAAIEDAVGTAGFDLAVELALVRGTLKERTVVL
jgi:glycosyltransferase involved in cell wall biosynthesis